MRRQPPLGELGGAKSLPLNSSLGLGSALGEKGKKSAWAKKKEPASKASREVAQATAGLTLLANIFPI